MVRKARTALRVWLLTLIVQAPSSAPHPCIQFLLDVLEQYVRDETAEPPTLQKTKTGNPQLGSVHTTHGIVAAPGFSAKSTFTTPNAESHCRLCAQPGHNWRGPAAILWRTFLVSDWKLAQCGVPGVGRLKPDLVAQRDAAARAAFAEYDLIEEVLPECQRTARFLMLCVRHTLDRLCGSPIAPTIIISLAVHVQQLVLEFWGLLNWIRDVRDVVKNGDYYRTRPWDVLGAHTPDQSEAWRLHYAGIPVWLQQEISYKLVVQLCISQLPRLLEGGDNEGPPTKHLCEGAMFVREGSSSLGLAATVFFLQGDHEVRMIGHGLPAQLVATTSSQTSTSTQPSRRARAQAKKKALTGVQPQPPPPQNLIPARQWYAIEHVQEYAVWSRALQQYYIRKNLLGEFVTIVANEHEWCKFASCSK
ncbi:hypothetical protein OH76DRAFT_1421453 [Lentinus brumalis]|uniref:Uncharacterized protein n=1 Tax=Lentinus brumalis TaxID=2498619 RepID=A0A371CVP8_9APHY|nr:hypothetical protein OH76DRAFT_1421453 [Polyporus brumalis]